MHVLQSLRCLSRSATGAGGLMAQFCAFAVSIDGPRRWGEARNTWTQTQTQTKTKTKTYSTDDVATFTALMDHVTSAAARLAVIAPAILHIMPIAGSGTITQQLFGVDGIFLVAAMQRQGQESASILD